MKKLFLTSFIVIAYCFLFFGQIIVSPNHTLGQQSINVSTPGGIYFSAKTITPISSSGGSVYFLDQQEVLNLLVNDATIQFELNGLLYVKQETSISTIDISNNINTVVPFYFDPDIIIVSRTVIFLNSNFYFVGYASTTGNYSVIELDQNGIESNRFPFPGPIENTVRIHDDQGVIYVSSNTTDPFQNYYYKLDFIVSSVQSIAESEYDMHPYPDNNGIEEVEINGEIFTINLDGQLTSSLNQTSLTCFDLMGEEDIQYPVLIGNIGQNIYMSLEFNQGSPDGIYRYPEGSTNGLCNPQVETNLALDFDGIDDFLSISNYSLPNNAFTINFWFKAFNNSNTSETRFFSMAGNGSVLEIGIEKGGSSDGNLWFHDTEASPSVFSVNQFVEDGQWHHLALVRNGTMGDVYFDGMHIHTYTTTGFPTNSYGTSTVIGKYIGTGGFLTNLQGQLDDIAIWTIPLTQADITELQNCELNGSELGLSAFWDFNVGIAEADNNLLVTNIPDQTGNGNNLFLQNIALVGSNSNLVTSTTGVYNNCNMCNLPPTALCQSGLTFTIDDLNPTVTVTVNDINNGSTTVCGGPPTLSFDMQGLVTSITYDCTDEPGLKTVELFATDANGLQSSCITTFTLMFDGEIATLKDFYNLSDGDNWTNTLANNSAWFSNCLPCGDASQGIQPWFGIICNAMKQVTTIYMPQNNLVGTLPSSLCGLPELFWFDVSGNPNPSILNLSGNLPDICCLNLLYFVVRNNQFTGQIPGCLATMNNLIDVNVTENNLEGPIPAFGSHQSNLADLQFHGNSFTGSIPGSIGSIPSLNDLTLYNNNLSGCYAQQLIGLCNKPGLTLSNALVSDGNPSLTPWEDFCNNGDNACCPPSLVIDWTPLVDGIYRSSGDIILQTNISSSSSITLSHGVGSAVNPIPPVTIGNLSNLIINNNGCNPSPTDVTNPTTGKIWMDRNLGATQVATSSIDAASYGDLYQWGRDTDGHEKRNSGITSTNATTAVPNAGNAWDGLFITEFSSSYVYDWLIPQDNTLWQGVNGTNNPCPSGYRLPTEAEWETERRSWSSNNSDGAFASPLKLPMAGGRTLIDGSITDVGTNANGRYWSSTVSGTNSFHFSVNINGAGEFTRFRAYGYSVRCIKD